MNLQKINSATPSKTKSIFGFTLVELIVVITILAILGTIGFLAIGSYSSKARDSERTSDMVNLAKGMEVLLARGVTLPQPDMNMITLTASGTPIGYQGYAGANTLRTTGLGGEFQDPLTGNFYTYSTNISQNKYQILGLLENGDNLSLTLQELPGIPTAHAWVYDSRYPITKGASLGILLGTWASLNQPVQELYQALSFTGVDIMNTSTEYGAYFSNKNIISGTGTKLVTLKTSYAQKNDFIAYDSALVGYWDMETTTADGKLVDMSGNGRNGIWASGIVFWGTDGNGKTGKATNFNGTNQYINLGTFDPSNGDMTVSFWLYKDVFNSTNTEEIIGKRDGWLADLSDHRWAIYIHGVSKWLKFGRNGVEVGTTNIAKIGSWTHYTFLYSTGSTAKWYENGVLSGSGVPYTFGSKTNASISVGRAGSQNGEYMLGKLDELRFYNKALSDSEIQALYNGTK